MEKMDGVYYYGESDSIINYIKNGDIGVLSSISEGLPLAILEYGYAGIGVISTEVGHIPEIIRGCGKLVPPKNPNALYQAFHEYLSNTESMKKDIQNLKKRVYENYSECAVLNKYLNFIQLIEQS